MVFIEKIIALVVLFSIFFSFGSLPLLLQYSLLFKNIVAKIPAGSSYINCFAGGIFLATCMLHLVPDSLREMENILNKNFALKTKYPLGGLFISMGLFLVFLLEYCIEMSFKRIQNKSSELSADDRKICEKTTLQSQKEVKKYVTDDENERLLEENVNTNPEIEQKKVLSNAKENCCEEESENNEKEKNSSKENIELENNDTDAKKHGGRFGVVISAISFHMLFEGLAVGLQKTEAAVWALLIPMGLHKCMLAISVGTLIMENTRSSKAFIVFIALSSLITPLGIAIGISISEYENSVSTIQLFVSSKLRCIAAGTFLYVTFFEILQKELGSDLNLFKFLFVILGYLVIALLRLINM